MEAAAIETVVTGIVDTATSLLGLLAVFPLNFVAGAMIGGLAFKMLAKAKRIAR